MFFTCFKNFKKGKKKDFYEMAKMFCYAWVGAKKNANMQIIKGGVKRALNMLYILVGYFSYNEYSLSYFFM